MTRKTILMASSAVAMMAMTSPAWAQTATQAPAGVQTATGGAEQGGLAEIVVTAERRAASTQKTALTITAISGADLQKGGVVDSRTMLDSVPGLKLTVANPNAYIGLYGLASGAGTQYADAIMAFNYGGVPLARQTSASSAYYDVERVEILKGPQGTLYGRNATVGAINVIPAKPKDKLEAGATLTLGNYNTVNSQGYFNAPLSDTLAGRIAFQTTRHDGYFTNGYDDANNYGGRISLLYRPSSDFSLLLFGDGYWNRSKGPYSTFTYYSSSTQKWIDPSNPWFGLGAGGTCSNQLLCPTFAATSVGGVNAVSNPSGFTNTTATGYGNRSVVGSDGYVNNDQYILSAELNWTTSIGNLTVQPSYVHTNINYLTYSNGLIFSNNTKADQESLEARLASKGDGPLRWVLGGFLFQEKQNAFQSNVQSAGYALIVTPNLRDSNYAFFGDATYSVTSQLRLTGGLRYTRETKSQDGYSTSTGLSATDVATIAGAGGSACYSGGTPAAPTLYQGLYYSSNLCIVPNGGRYQASNLSWKAGAEFDPRQGSLLYATVKTGFRAGGLAVGTQNTYKPEKLTAYEIGSKNRFFGGKLQANVSAFYWRYKDQQISQIQVFYVNGVVGGQTSIPSNFDGNLYGAEANIDVLVTPADRISGDILYAGGKYDSTPPVATVNTPTLTTQYNLRRINLPHWQMTGTYEHTFHLANGAAIAAAAHSHFESSTPLRIIDPALLTPGDIRAAYAKVDLDLTYRGAGDRWSLQLFVRNLTNKAVIGVGSSGQTSLPTFYRPTSDAANVRSATLDPPRTFGATLNMKY